MKEIKKSKSLTDNILVDTEMDGPSNYEEQMTWQEQRLLTHAHQIREEEPRPSAQKNIDSIFGHSTNLYVVSSLCSYLNPHLLEGKKLDLSAPRHTLMDTNQTLANEGNLPNDEIMVDILAKIAEDMEDNVR